MLLYPNSKIYILCAGGVQNDSIELCHRLCSRLIRLGVDAKMVYVPVTENFNPDNPVHPACKAFHVPYTYQVEDISQNIMIVPETLNTYLYSVKKIRRVIWWLSVDNFFRDLALGTVAHFDKILTTPMAKFFCFQSYDADIEHWTQSEYAKKFLKVNGIPDEKIYHIGDFISPTLIKLHNSVDLKAKKNIVVFNAATSSKIIPQLQKLVKNAEWTAYQDKSPAELPKLFADAKVYVDFGDFPCKEMMPRRAAILGCVLVTGKRGSAGNSVDLNIPAEFKFGDAEDDAPNIAKKINEILSNFKSAYGKQKSFRDKIFGEKKNFEKNVSMTLGIKKEKSELEPAAIFNGLNETGVAVAEILSKNEVGLSISYVINDNPDNENNPELNITRNKDGVFITINENQKLPVITSDDARFLYNEGRIKKIILLTADKLEENFVKEKINPLKDDIISTNFEE